MDDNKGKKVQSESTTRQRTDNVKVDKCKLRVMRSIHVHPRACVWYSKEVLTITTVLHDSFPKDLKTRAESMNAHRDKKTENKVVMARCAHVSWALVTVNIIK